MSEQQSNDQNKVNHSATDFTAATEDETTAKTEAKTDEDDELDALLDDALEGFSKPVLAESTPATSSEGEVSDNPTTKTSEIIWSEEFMMQASAEFEKNLRLMMAENTTSGADAELSETLFKASQEAAAKVFEGQQDQAFGTSFADTLRFLAEGTESLQAEPDEEALAKMLEKMAFGTESGFGGDGASGDLGGLGGLGGLGDILPAMQGMLQSLLSKDLLYPSIKEIVNKYPDWLADNRSKLEASEYEKYNRQFSIMQQVCTEFEAEQESDDEQTKIVRFEKILTLMQEMQECGHPPKELAGEAVNIPNPFAGAADFSQAAGNLPPVAENCTIM